MSKRKQIKQRSEAIKLAFVVIMSVPAVFSFCVLAYAIAENMTF